MGTGVSRYGRYEATVVASVPQLTHDVHFARYLHLIAPAKAASITALAGFFQSAPVIIKIHRLPLPSQLRRPYVPPASLRALISNGAPI